MKEDESSEFKKSTSELKEAVVSITAILNKHNKGTLYFGIDNLGKPVGLSFSEKSLREISQRISHSIEPRLFPEIKKVLIDGKDCIKVSFEGQDAPYFAFGRAYVRVGDENRQLSAKELENMILRKSETKWDSRILGDVCEVNEKILREFVKKANQAGRISFSSNVLEKLHLTKKGKLTNAGRILFSKDGPVELQMAVFAGQDKTTFLDIKQHRGNIFELMDRAESYIKQHIDWRAELLGRRRKEIPEIPIRAITEALVNSFCHRDYQAPESNKIAVFKDRVEIWNPGEFPEGYVPEDFIRKDLPSILRNPLIANCLYLSADIEKWGSGLKRIYEECKGLVSFKVMHYGFSVVFKRKTRVKTVVKTRVKTVVKTRVKTVVKTSDKIVDEITKNPRITNKELHKLTGLSVRGIEWNLAKLKLQGRIKRIGPKKGGHWEVL